MKSLACIVPIYGCNPDDPRLENHRRAIRRLEKEGIDVYTIAAVTPEEKYQKSPLLEVADLVRCSASEVWHKEGLINSAARALKDDYSILAWVDSGLYLSPGWSQLVRNKVEDGYDVIQCYSHGVWLNECNRVASTRVGYMFNHGLSSRARKQQTKLAGGTLPQGTKASVGGAWAATSSMFDRVSLYDRNVVGGGDSWAIQGLCRINAPEGIATRCLSPPHGRHAKDWMRLARKCQLVAGYVPGNYYHLWHTTMPNRQHLTRHRILQRHEYDPAKHTWVNSEGLVEWTEQAPPELIRGVREYLHNRH